MVTFEKFLKKYKKFWQKQKNNHIVFSDFLGPNELCLKYNQPNVDRNAMLLITPSKHRVDSTILCE